MTLLSKGLNEKDKNLKSQLLIVTKNDEKTSSENVWLKNGFLRILRVTLIFLKKDFPENTLVYINQAHLSIKKSCWFIIIILFWGK